MGLAVMKEEQDHQYPVHRHKIKTKKSQNEASIAIGILLIVPLKEISNTRIVMLLLAVVKEEQDHQYSVHRHKIKNKKSQNEASVAAPLKEIGKTVLIFIYAGLQYCMDPVMTITTTDLNCISPFGLEPPRTTL